MWPEHDLFGSLVQMCDCRQVGAKEELSQCSR